MKNKINISFKFLLVSVVFSLNFIFGSSTNAQILSQNYLWAKSSSGFGTYGNTGDVVTDASGNVYVSGVFSSPTITFGNTVLTYISDAYSNVNGYLVKYDASGALLWAKNFPSGLDNYSSGNAPFPIHICADGSGNVYVSETYYSPYDNIPVISKYDASGNLLWTKQATSNVTHDDLYPTHIHHGFGDSRGGIAADGSGNVYITGVFAYSISFGTYTLTGYNIDGGNVRDVYIAKYNSQGNVSWVQQISNSTNSSAGKLANSIAADSYGNIIVTGGTSGSSLNFGGIILNTFAGGTGFITKYSSSGMAMWAKNVNDAYANVSADGTGNSYCWDVNTLTKYNVNGDTLWRKPALYGIKPFTDVNGNSYSYAGSNGLTKYDASGHLLWARTMPAGAAVTADLNGNIFVHGGFSTPNIIFGGTSLTNSNSNGTNTFLTKICQQTRPVITSSGSDTLCQGNTVTLTSTAATSYLWSTGATTQSIMVSTSGNYSVITYNANGCAETSLSKTILVENPLSPVITPNGATTFCQGGNVNLSSSQGNNYLWSNGLTASNIDVHTAGNYTVTQTNSCGSYTSAVTSVQVNPNPPTPTITPIGPFTFCQGDSVILTSSASSGISWNTNATTPSIKVTETGGYSVIVTGLNGCSAPSVQVIVNVIPSVSPSVSIAASANPSCDGALVNFTASPINGGIQTQPSYQWQIGGVNVNNATSATYSYSPQSGDALSCLMTSGETCTIGSHIVNSNIVHMIVNPAPQQPSSISGNLTVTEGSTQTYTISPVSGALDYTWTLPYGWTGNSNSTSITATVSNLSGVISVTANNAICPSIARTINVHNLTGNPIATNGGSSFFFCGNDVHAFGSNGQGQLGVNNTAENNYLVSGSFLGFSTGGLHSLFFKSDGTAWASGFNANGQLGNNSTVNQNTPVQVIGLTGIIAVAAGGSHSLFLKNDGTVWACGDNGTGQLGDNSTSENHVATQIAGLSGIVAIAAGASHSLFLKNDGSVWACGGNYNGELGDNTIIDRHAPIQVLGVNSILAISANLSQSFFLKNDGSVWACGNNGYGQLGNNTLIDQHIATQISGLTGIVSVAAGESHTLFLKNDGTVWACGGNYGGGGTPGSWLSPAQISGLNNIKDIAAGYNESFAVKNDNSFLHWGSTAQLPSYFADSINIGGTVSENIINIFPCCPRPDVPNVIASQPIVCNGNSSTLSIGSAQLRGASVWKWYSGSCGGTLQGSGDSITVSPLVNTYYHVRGEGSCIIGYCGYISIKTSPDVPTGLSQLYRCTNSTTLDLLPNDSTIHWFSAATGGNALSTNIGLIDENHYYASKTINGCESQSRLDVKVLLRSGLWKGGTSGDWENALNWCSGVPTDTASVIIQPANDASFMPYISAPLNHPATCNNLLISNGSSLMIFPSKALTVIGTLDNQAGINGLIIKSDSLGTGSLLHNSDLVSGVFEHFISDSTWNLISSPFELGSGATSGALNPHGVGYLHPYTDGTGWGNYISSSSYALNPLQGYAIWLTPRNIITFSGSFSNGPKTKSLVFGNSWNLIGNPYPSSLDWDSVTRVNTTASVYFWDNTYAGVNGGNYKTYNGLSMIGVPQSTSSAIPPFQGFFVQTTADNGSVTFGNNARIHSSQAFYKSATLQTQVLTRLKITDSQNRFDELAVCLNSNATNNFDNFDSKKMSAGSNAPEIYSIAQNEHLVINTLQNVSAVVPVSILTSQAGNFSFHAFDLINDNNMNVFLEDYQLGTMTDLKSHPDLTFNLVQGVNSNRFFLHFSDVTSIKNNAEPTNLLAYSNQNQLIITTNQPMKWVGLIDINGKEIASKNCNSNTYQFNTETLSKGVYLIKAVFANLVVSKKVIIY